MFKICGIIEISKIEFFNFSSTERVKRNQKKLKTIRNLLSFKTIIFQAIPTKAKHFFWFLTENWTLFLSGTRGAGPNTVLSSNSNISKTVTVNFVFTQTQSIR